MNKCAILFQETLVELAHKTKCNNIPDFLEEIPPDTATIRWGTNEIKDLFTWVFFHSGDVAIIASNKICRREGVVTCVIRCSVGGDFYIINEDGINTLLGCIKEVAKSDKLNSVDFARLLFQHILQITQNYTANNTC